MRLSTLAILAALSAAFPATAYADASPAPAASPSISPEVQAALKVASSRLDTLFQTGHSDPAWFTQSVLDHVPASKIDDIAAQIKAQLGAYKSVEFTPDGFVAHFEKGTDLVLMHMNAENQIDSLWFKPPQLLDTK